MADPENIVAPPPAEPQGAPPPTEPVVERSQLELAVLKPIPGANPTGIDPAYDEDFLRIKAEIDRIGTVTGKVDQKKVMQNAKELQSARGLATPKERAAAEEAMRHRSALSEAGGPDFRLVVELATRILTEKSKDLRIACYLCLALWRTQRVGGMAEGLSVILLLIQEYWDGMFPAKGRAAARKGGLDFLILHLAEELNGSNVVAGDRLHLERVKTVASSLEKELSSRMAENAPAMVTLGRAVDDSIARLPKPAAPAAPAPAAAGVQVAPAQPAAAAAPEAELKTLQGAVDLVRKVSTFLRTQDRKSIAPYRLLRSMRWDFLVHEPPNENGKTRIEPPPAPRRTYLEGLKPQGQWEKLLEEGEGTFAENPFHFWLDLQHLVVSALDGLGFEYGAAKTAVLQDVGILLQRLPKLSSLTFSDGTPFASPAARAWIDEAVLPALGGGGPAPSAAPSGSDTRLAAAFEEAKVLVDRGDLVTAVTNLQALALPPRSRRAAFERRLDIALLCIRGNQIPMASPILEELNEEIERGGLAEWDPPLILETWKTLGRCYHTLAAAAPAAGKQVLLDQAAKVFEKICRLDVNTALAMAGAKPKAVPKPAAAAEPVRTEAVAAEGGDGSPAAVNKSAAPAPGA